MATLFFSYSHRDEALRDELEIHLTSLKRQGIISFWHDRRIGAGTEFGKVISEHLEAADIILLLISPYFIASDYCYDVEMKRAMERHEAGEARVIPVILRRCEWQPLPFGKLLATPIDGKPISQFPDQHEAFFEVTAAIRKAVEEINAKSVTGIWIETATEISKELQDECVELLKSFDELKTADNLRAFASTKDLKLIRDCVDFSDEIKHDQLVLQLLNRRRPFSEPLLFDLLDELARRYRKSPKGQACKDLKEKIRKEIPPPEDWDQAFDYQKLVQSSAIVNGEDIIEHARRWIDKAASDPDELALRITLSVFNGSPFDVIESAHKDLLDSLREALPPPNPEKTDSPGLPVPLMHRLREAEAHETIPKTSGRKGVIEITPQLAVEAINYVWQLYRERVWRQPLIEWLTSYAAAHSLHVRTRAAIAAGRLGLVDYPFFRDYLLTRWARADSHQSQYRTAIGMALGVLAREERFAGEVESLLEKWAQSDEQALRWAAARAYIYVGAYCQDVSAVIARWRDIANSEAAAIDIQILGDVYVRLNNPLHMSLVDAMIRFFMNIGGLPEEEKRPLFEGILKGLEGWIVADSHGVSLGLFMFTALGRINDPSGGAHGVRPPLLLQLVENEQPAHSRYREQLASLFYLTLSKAASVEEARNLLCAWLKWIDGLHADAQSYEARLQALLADIIAADSDEEMRGRLKICIESCGQSGAATRVLANL